MIALCSPKRNCSSSRAHSWTMFSSILPLPSSGNFSRFWKIYHRLLTDWAHQPIHNMLFPSVILLDTTAWKVLCWSGRVFQSLQTPLNAFSDYMEETPTSSMAQCSLHDQNMHSYCVVTISWGFLFATTFGLYSVIQARITTLICNDTSSILYLVFK